jgi:hypothetical protein
VPIGHHHREIELESAEAGEKEIPHGSDRLEHGETRRQGNLFDRRGHQGRAGATLRLVGLGDDTGNGKALSE